MSPRQTSSHLGVLAVVSLVLLSAAANEVGGAVGTSANSKVTGPTSAR